MIRSAERTMTEGRVFRFQTIPVDPVDLFRGRYVALQFEATSGPAAPEEELDWGMRAYARLRVDANGFAEIERVSTEKPEDSEYLSVRVQSTHEGEAHFAFPVTRFYMEESIAPIAEQVYRERRAGLTWANIRVRDGHALIEDVLIDSVSLRTAAERHRSREEP